MRLLVLLCSALFCHALAQTVTYVDTFDNQTNYNNWEFGAFADEGGNPGSFLYVEHSLANSIEGGSELFHGDYRARKVLAIGLDLRSYNLAYDNPDTSKVTLVLRDDKGTTDPTDDVLLYKLGERFPLPEQGWVHYRFDIPAQEAQLPSGWAMHTFMDNTNDSWAQSIAHVTDISIAFGDPTAVYIENDQSMGLDNVSIILGDPASAGDLNGDAVVDCADLHHLAEMAGPCQPTPVPCPADLDGSGVVDAADLAIAVANFVGFRPVHLDDEPQPLNHPHRRPQP